MKERSELEASTGLVSSTCSATPRLDEIRDHVSKLKCLLDDPQPELASWAQLYHERMTAINDFWLAK